MLTVDLPSIHDFATIPLSRASSHTGSLGHEVRHVSMTSS